MLKQIMRAYATVSASSLDALRASLGGRIIAVDPTPGRLRDTWQVRLDVLLDSPADHDRADYIPCHSE